MKFEIGKLSPDSQGRERRSETANQHAQDIYKNPTLTGIHPGQGNANRSDRANAMAQNSTKNPNLIISEAGASVELGGDTSGGESVTATGTTSTNSAQSDFLYYYHPDHLGSTGFVTDQNGELYEHMEYFPFGESWVQEHSNTQRTPYLYTGKELDEETQLYYYGARYYDPRTSVWQSVDPILGIYLDGKPNSGVFDSANINLYAYVGNHHQINAKDLNGKWAGIDDAIAIIGGAVLGAGAQGVADLCKGEVSSWKSYAAAAVGGAVGAEAALYTGGIASGAAGGAAYSLTNQLLNKGDVSAGELVLDTGVSALTAGLGEKVLPALFKSMPNRKWANDFKGMIGESASLLYNFAKGNKYMGKQQEIPGLTTIVDSVWQTKDGAIKYVESKFGTSSLSKAQRTAKRTLGAAYQIERWGYDWVGRMGTSLGNALGIGASAGQKENPDNNAN